MSNRIDISHKTVIFIIGFLAALWVLFQIKEIILLLFVALILMSTLSPIVDWLNKRLKLPKALSIAVTYLVILSVVTILISLIIRPFISETTVLIGNLPHTLEGMLPTLGVNKDLLQQELTTISKNAFSFTLALFTNVLTFISIGVLTFYLLLDKERLYNLVIQLFPSQKERTENLILKIEAKLGAWFRGQILLTFIIGTFSYILLTLLNVPYALPLAIFAGIMEAIPVIGPIVSAIPAILVAYVVSPPSALFVAVGYFAIQQSENHLIVPQVMKRAVGLNPLIVILAIAVGGKLLGISGGVLAVPITVVLQIILEELLNVDLDTYSHIKDKTT